MPQELIVFLYILGAMAVAFVVTFASTPLVKLFAQKVGAVDVPMDNRRMHKVPMARLGGLAIFLGFIFSVIIFGDISRQMQGILIGSVIIVILGILDDIMRIDAKIKLVVQIIAALVTTYHGVVIDIFTNPNIFSSEPYLQLGFLSVPITVIWIVAITNAVNFIDGLDGLAVGVSAIASFSLLVVAVMVSEPPVAIIMACLTGSCLGFMPYNLNPAKIFMGDTGATFLGFILATMSIQGFFKLYAIISFAVPFLVLGLPIFDITFAVFRRLMKGQSPGHADRSHVHHRLIDMGFSQKQSVAILYTLSAILALSAVVLTSSGEIRAILLLVAVFVTAVIGLKVIWGNSNEKNGEASSVDVGLADGSYSAESASSTDNENQTPGNGDTNNE